MYLPTIISMKVIQEIFGKLPGAGDANLYTITNSNGITLRISDYGGIIQSILVPDKYGKLDDVVLGFDSLEGYLKDHPYVGTLVGRYANRISKGRFVLDGTEYELTLNHGFNHIHGGHAGFDKVLWQASEFADKKGAGITLEYISHDMEEGYPGFLRVSVSYTLDDENRVCLDYRATTDEATPINLTNHAYFNLNGAAAEIYDHELMIPASKYVVTDQDLIPTGEIRSVEGSPLDFRVPKLIGKDIHEVEGGFDHCYVLDGAGREPELAARVIHRESGRAMETFTTEPGVQFYSSNFLADIIGRGGTKYRKHLALCLETQHFPDSPNHPNFPSTILRPGEIYTQRTIYKFSLL
jgi:aldose 1-epimerase